MIRTFADEATRQFWELGKSRRVPSAIRRVAARKLLMLHAATRLDDLRSPPGNRIEKLRGEREGQHSIRINDQYRVCCAWRDGDAYDVEVTDYH